MVFRGEEEKAIRVFDGPCSVDLSHGSALERIRFLRKLYCKQNFLDGKSWPEVKGLGASATWTKGESHADALVQVENEGDTDALEVTISKAHWTDPPIWGDRSVFSSRKKFNEWNKFMGEHPQNCSADKLERLSPQERGYIRIRVENVYYVTKHMLFSGNLIATNVFHEKLIPQSLIADIDPSEDFDNPFRFGTFRLTLDKDAAQQVDIPEP